MMFKGKVWLPLLCLFVQGVFGQEAQDTPCNCDEIARAHEKCVGDWSSLDELRRSLEQQVRDVEFHANERCQVQVEQVQREEQARVEQLVRSESQVQIDHAQAELSQLRSESQVQIDHAQAELSQCRAQHQELNAQFEEQGNTHRRLQESSQDLEQTLESVRAEKSKLEKNLESFKSEKSKLEKSMSDKERALGKVKKEKKSVQRELESTKKTLEEMIASKTIISIDWDLLNDRIEEIKGICVDYTKDFTATVQEYLELAKEKLMEYLQLAQQKFMEFYSYVEQEVYPHVERTIEKDIIPFVKSSWKQAQVKWEEIYGPIRPQVNEKIAIAKKEWKKFYKQNLETFVKEHKLDVHASNAKKTVDDYMTSAHNNLLRTFKTASGVALNFAKLEEAPDSVVTFLQKVHANYDIVVLYFEINVAVLVAYFILVMIFFRPKKKVPKSLKKKLWMEKEAAAGKNKQQVQLPKNKHGNNGQKNNKKNK